MTKNKPIRDSIQLIKNNWKLIGLIAIFDMLFILLLVNLRVVSGNVNAFFYIKIFQLGSGMRVLSLLIIAVVEILLLIAIYSFFKYLVLGNIQEIFRKKELSFNRFFSFLKINWIICSPVIILYMVIALVMVYYMNRLMTTGAGSPLSLILNFLFVAVIILILLVYFYTLLNLAHFIFLREENLKKTIKQVFIGSFKLSSYKIYWHNFKILLVSSAVLLFFYSFMKLFVLTDISAYLRYGGIYKWGIYSIIIIAGYLLLLFNRINFYEKYVLHK